MTFLCASMAVGGASDLELALERAAEAARRGAQLIEWRIDSLAEEPGAATMIAQLVKESPVPCIVTCRLAEEGGHYGGDEQTRISLLEALGTASHPPRYFDLELAAYARSANLRLKVNLAVDHAKQARDLKTALILSTHDFSGRPRDLIQRVEAMAIEPACAVIKVAWMARSLRDNLEAFDLLHERCKPMIALCMGEFGVMSRVLAGKFGALLTFAGTERGEETAPGQPTIADLRDLYRFDRIAARTKVYGVIGWPVRHSLSPAIHNAAFEAVGHDGVYLPLPIPPAWEHFKATVSSLVDHPHLDFRGASVTIPHKENLLRFVIERGGKLDSAAALVGAANTLIIHEDRSLEAVNTDAPAVIESLVAGMGIEARSLVGRRIAVLGAGGMARAAAAGLSAAGATVVIFNRTAARAEAMVADLSARVERASAPMRLSVGRMNALACGCFHAFINCTPLGMAGGPRPDESALPDDVPLDESVTVMDTVYAPQRTPLIQRAESRGARAITGMDMFLRQAAMQLERWTGRVLSHAECRALLRANVSA
jgi:3-dehydroquinate dehydratase/shikimate dehydrogenase